MNTGYRSVIAKDFPARATVKAGLVGADGLVEQPAHPGLLECRSDQVEPGPGVRTRDEIE